MEATSKAISTRERGEGLGPLKRQFEQWRAARKGGERIPPSLWAGAIEAVQEHGAYRVAAELRLDYAVLKRRAGLSTKTGKVPTPALMPRFVELFAAGGSPSSAPAQPQCVVELDSARGTKMRVELNGDALASLSVLCSAFWAAR
jgi:hypothetical protein